jgi:Niemann-Pick C1 protein
MSQWDAEGENGWETRVRDCAASPAECLPDFGQPIDPKLVLGGAQGEWLNAKSLVITYVVANSLDKNKVEKAAEWERTLQKYLADLQANSRKQANVQIAYSTEVSLEAELNKVSRLCIPRKGRWKANRLLRISCAQSTNTDVRIVVASYLVMFLYVSLTLGGGVSPDLFLGEHGVLAGLRELCVDALVMLKLRKASEGGQSSGRAGTPPPKRQYMASLLSTLLSVKSKSLLGLFGICIVLIAVSSSVGLFSWMGVRVTLIIAEVIPFLVLAVGVDNVFILVHELDRQNSIHGPGSKTARGPSGAYTESLDGEMEAPSHLPAEERVARTLARMGPSILLSSTTEIVAFGLGALVPMPAVRNFALYAAGSVLLGALLQVTVFVSAMTLDLRRAEVSCNGFLVYCKDN